MAKRQSLALILLPDGEEYALAEIGGLELECYQHVIAASRKSKPFGILKSIESKGPIVEYLPLDSEEIFKRAKADLKDALTDFRKWFCSKSPGKKTMWWLTWTSFQHLENEIFKLFLCSEFQNSILYKYTDFNVTCFLVTREVLAHFFDWPIQTRIVCPHSKLTGLFKLLAKDIYLLIGRFSARLVLTLSVGRKLPDTAMTDVCFIAWGWWERSQGKWRDMYYTSLPKRLKDMGFSVKILMPEKAMQSRGKDRLEIDGVISFGLHSTLLTAAQIGRFMLSSIARAIRFKAEEHGASHWIRKVLLIQLLTHHGALLGNLVLFNSFKRFFHQHPAKIVIFYDEVYPHGRALQMALSSLPQQTRPITIGFQHGWVCENHLTYNTDPGNPDMPFPACDYFFAYNRLAAETFKELLHESRNERIRIVGMHRVRTQGTLHSGNMDELGSLDGLDHTQPVFLLLGDDSVKDAWNIICDLNRSNKIQLIVKPHPFFPIPRDWLKGFALHHGSKLYYSESYDLDHVISVSDYILSPVSTALLNVIAQQKPILLFILDNRIDLYQIGPWLESSSEDCFARSAEELKGLLLKSSKSKPTGKVAYDHNDLYMPPFLGEASVDAMSRELKEILKKGRSACYQ